MNHPNTQLIHVGNAVIKRDLIGRLTETPIKGKIIAIEYNPSFERIDVYILDSNSRFTNRAALSGVKFAATNTTPEIQ